MALTDHEDFSPLLAKHMDYTLYEYDSTKVSLQFNGGHITVDSKDDLLTTYKQIINILYRYWISTYLVCIMDRGWKMKK